MSLGDVVALIEADQRAQVAAQTWGHLAPEVGQVYSGTILLAHSAYGDGSVVISAEFGDLPDSPWFYDGLCDFVNEHGQGEDVVGKVFRFIGTYEFRNWPDVWDEDEDELVREGGHEHVFKGEFVEIAT